MKKVFIYKVVNKVNNKVYIGKTINPTSRKADHFREYKKDLGWNKTLYQAMNKYGQENFSFEVVEEVSDSDWGARENYWIEKYDSLKNGYNMIPGGTEPPRLCGESNPNSKLKLKEVKEIRNLLRAQKGILYKDIAEKYSISIYQVYRINSGEAWNDPQEKYPIRKINRFTEEQIKEITFLLKKLNLVIERSEISTEKPELQ